MFYTYAEKQSSTIWGEWKMRLVAFDTMRRYVYYSEPLPSSYYNNNSSAAAMSATVTALPHATSAPCLAHTGRHGRGDNNNNGSNSHALTPTTATATTTAAAHTHSGASDTSSVDSRAATTTTQQQQQQQPVPAPTTLPRGLRWKRKLKLTGVLPQATVQEFCPADPHLVERDYYQLELTGEERSLAKTEIAPPGPLLCASAAPYVHPYTPQLYSSCSGDHDGGGGGGGAGSRVTARRQHASRDSVSHTRGSSSSSSSNRSRGGDEDDDGERPRHAHTTASAAQAGAASVHHRHHRHHHDNNNNDRRRDERGAVRADDNVSNSDDDGDDDDDDATALCDLVDDYDDEYVRDAYGLRDLYDALREQYVELERDRRRAARAAVAQGRPPPPAPLTRTLASPRSRVYSTAIFPYTSQVTFTLRCRNECEMRRLWYVLQMVLGYDGLEVLPYRGLPPYDPRNGLLFAHVPMLLWQSFAALDKAVFYTFIRGNLMHIKGSSSNNNGSSGNSSGSSRHNTGSHAASTNRGGSNGDDSSSSDDNGGSSRHHPRGNKHTTTTTAITAAAATITQPARVQLDVWVHGAHLCITHDMVLFIRDTGTIPCWLHLGAVRALHYHAEGATPYVVFLSDRPSPDVVFVPQPPAYGAAAQRDYRASHDVRRVHCVMHELCYASRCAARRVVELRHVPEASAAAYVRRATAVGAALSLYPGADRQGVLRALLPKETLATVWADTRRAALRMRRGHDGVAEGGSGSDNNSSSGRAAAAAAAGAETTTAATAAVLTSNARVGGIAAGELPAIPLYANTAAELQLRPAQLRALERVLDEARESHTEVVGMPLQRAQHLRVRAARSHTTRHRRPHGQSSQQQPSSSTTTMTRRTASHGHGSSSGSSSSGGVANATSTTADAMAGVHTGEVSIMQLLPSTSSLSPAAAAAAMNNNGGGGGERSARDDEDAVTRRSSSSIVTTTSCSNDNDDDDDTAASYVQPGSRYITREELSGCGGVAAGGDGKSSSGNGGSVIELGDVIAEHHIVVQDSGADGMYNGKEEADDDSNSSRSGCGRGYDCSGTAAQPPP